MAEMLVIGLLLLLAGILVAICLLGTFGGHFKEIRPTVEDEILVATAKRRVE